MASNFTYYVAAKHGVAESTLLKATKVGHHFNLVNDSVDIDNGSVCKLGDYIKSDLFKAEIPAKGDRIILMLSAPKIYEEYTTKMQEESNFFNAKGEDIRGYEVEQYDRFTLSAEAFSDDAAPAVDKYVVVDGTGFKLTTVDEAPDAKTYGFIGKIYTIANNGNFRIIVEKNSQVYA